MTWLDKMPFHFFEMASFKITPLLVKSDAQAAEIQFYVPTPMGKDTEVFKAVVKISGEHSFVQLHRHWPK